MELNQTQKKRVPVAGNGAPALTRDLELSHRHTEFGVQDALAPLRTVAYG